MDYKATKFQVGDVLRDVMFQPTPDMVITKIVSDRYYTWYICTDETGRECNGLQDIIEERFERIQCLVSRAFKVVFKDFCCTYNCGFPSDYCRIFSTLRDMYDEYTEGNDDEKDKLVDNFVDKVCDAGIELDYAMPMFEVFTYALTKSAAILNK